MLGKEVNPDIPYGFPEPSPPIITEVECYEAFMREVSMADKSPNNQDTLSYYLSVRNQRGSMVRVRQSKLAAVIAFISSFLFQNGEHGVRCNRCTVLFTYVVVDFSCSSLS